MKYKVGDIVKIVYTADVVDTTYRIIDIDRTSLFPYRIDGGGEYQPWVCETEIILAASRKDPEEATEKDLGNETDAVVKGGRSDKHKFEFDNDDYMQGVKDGMDEAWEIVRELYRVYNMDELKSIFDGESSTLEIAVKYTASEAIEKLKAYEEKQSIKVGDEVIIDGEEIGIVWDIELEPDSDFGDYKEHPYLVISKRWAIWVKRENLRKTGRHFDQITEVLEQMKEEPEVDHTMTGDEIARLFEEE